MIRQIADCESYVCAVGTSLREALRRINMTEHLFQIVVGPDRRVRGTVTDGDIRRGVLNGSSLDDLVEQCMFTEFKFARAGDGAAIEAALSDRERRVKFLPVLDQEGALAALFVPGKELEPRVVRRCVVMAGGFGTRLGELTKQTPKPLLEVGGRPILDRVLEVLEDNGADEIYIAVHYLADLVEEFVRKRCNRAAITILYEDQPLGTAGALSKLPPDLGGPTLVVNGDVLTQVDFSALTAFHERHSVDGTIGVSPYEVQVPFGVVRVGADGLLSDIEEKPRITEFISAGIYVLSPQVLAMVPKNRPMDMPELLNRARGIGLTFGLFPIHEYWIDVGRIDDLERASADHKGKT